ncbi:MAG: hypothetical protein IJL32_04875 [Oscillospiraceae bacterium]|nr:hypothetical protein [Oscillospiraceae bacterium]
MTPASRCSSRNALQGAAVLILLRLSTFFCSAVPYTAALAKGMLTASLLQAAMLLPLLLCTDGHNDPPLLQKLLRIYAVLHAAVLTVSLCGLHRQEHLPRGVLLPLLLTAVLLYTVSRSDSATARAGVLLLCLACAGFLLLPLRWLRFAQPPGFGMPGSAAAGFLMEWQLSGELPLILLLRERRQRRDTLCSAGAWAVCKTAVLPLTVLFGAVQSGEMLPPAGSPFFRMLSREPLTDAVRTDGFWLMLCYACTALVITFCLQSAAPMQRGTRRLRIILPYLAVFALFSLSPGFLRMRGAAVLLTGFLLPAAVYLYRAMRHKKQKPQ